MEIHNGRGCSINTFVIHRFNKYIILSFKTLSQTGRAGELKLWANVHPPPCVTYHMSHVRCQVSGVICQMSYVIFFLQSCAASQLRVCYQRGLLCLVYILTYKLSEWQKNITNSYIDMFKPIKIRVLSLNSNTKFQFIIKYHALYIYIYIYFLNISNNFVTFISRIF